MYAQQLRVVLCHADNGELRNMIAELAGIQRNIDKANRTDRRVQNLASYINEDSLRAAYRRMDGKKAVGVDRVTKDEYGQNLDENLSNLVARMKKGAYKPHPSRRVFIPKDGKGKMRPLGISSFEDKLVETVVAEILTQIYEPKFYNFSYGFRPGRSCHMAVRETIKDIQFHYTNWVVEADIKGFFDNVDHEWLMKMLEHDIADRKLLEIIRRFLDAGIMEEGKYLDNETGTPQGNGISPILANIYLHYVLDNWFDVKVRSYCNGECHLVRYADDFIVCFAYPNDARWFIGALGRRLGRYGLQLAEDKTKMIEFGRFAMRNRVAKGEGKPETFDFLGFTFYCSMNTERTFFRCKVKTSKKKFRNKLRAMKEWIRNNRNMPLEWLFKKLNEKLRGHYQYYGVTDNIAECKKFYRHTVWFLYKYLNRRSQKCSYNKDTFFNGLLKTFPIVNPRIRVSLHYRNELGIVV